MIWACMVILTIAIAAHNKTISNLQDDIKELQDDNDWLNVQLAFMEEREGEKDEFINQANKDDI